MTRFHRLNMVIYEFFTDGKRTLIIGAYLLPSILEHLPDLEEALTHFRYQYTIVLGDLNSAIGKSQKPHSQYVADLLAEFGMIYLVHHFQQRWRYRDTKKWPRVRQVRAMRESSNYILGTNRRRFKMVGIS